ncbi:hypothetical protein [Deinococcus misasensis]|nr:hypothetical protein [Deinococcus misasensis]
MRPEYTNKLSHHGKAATAPCGFCAFCAEFFEHRADDRLEKELQHFGSF